MPPTDVRRVEMHNQEDSCAVFSCGCQGAHVKTLYTEFLANRNQDTSYVEFLPASADFGLDILAQRA
jgi:hypothetical protein